MYAWFPQLADTIDTVLENHKAHLLKEQEKLKAYDQILDDMVKSPNVTFSYDAGLSDEDHTFYVDWMKKVGLYDKPHNKIKD